MIGIFLPISIPVYMMNVEKISFPAKLTLIIISLQCFDSISVISGFKGFELAFASTIITSILLGLINTANDTQTLFSALFSNTCQSIGFLRIFLIAFINTGLATFFVVQPWIDTATFTQSISIPFSTDKSNTFLLPSETITTKKMSGLFMVFVTLLAHFSLGKFLFSLFADLLSTIGTGSKSFVSKKIAAFVTKSFGCTFLFEYLMSIHNRIISHKNEGRYIYGVR
jgi:hypothetical protein